MSLFHSVEQLPCLLDLTSPPYRLLRENPRDPQGPQVHRTHLKDPQGPRVSFRVDLQVDLRVGPRVDLRVDPLVGPLVDLRVDPLAGLRVDLLQEDPQEAIRGAAVGAAVAATMMALVPTSLATRLLPPTADLLPTGTPEAEARLQNLPWSLSQPTPTNCLIGKILLSVRSLLLPQTRRLLWPGFVQLSTLTFQKPR